MYPPNVTSLVLRLDRDPGKEFGIRLVLGATPAHLRGLVLRRGMTAAEIGVAIGIAAGLGLTRFMQSLLFETTGRDHGLLAPRSPRRLG